MRIPGWSKVARFYPRELVASAMALALCAGATVFFAARLSESYPIERWLIWHLLILGGWTLFLNLSLVMVGAAVLKRLFPQHVPQGEVGEVVEQARLPVSEWLLQSMIIGLTIFALSMFALGSIGAFSASTAVLLPLFFCALGVADLKENCTRLRASFVAQTPPSILGRVAALLAGGFGAVMIVFLYLESLTPNSLNFDAIWYHIPTAQDYAREGRILPFYGDNHRAYPHLTSLIQTWAFLVPGVEPVATRWMLILQLEFSFVLWRIVGVAAAAQWMLKGRWVPGLWAVFFLFPSVFIYDQNIAGSADHILGVSAIPLFLAVARFLPRFDWRWAVVAGAAAGCHILTKYQAVYLVVAVAVIVGCRFFWLVALRVLSKLRKQKLSPVSLSWKTISLGPALILFAALFVSGPHFLKNAIFYQNPVYPFMGSLFPSSFDDWEKPPQEKPPQNKPPQEKPEHKKAQPKGSQHKESAQASDVAALKGKGPDQEAQAEKPRPQKKEAQSAAENKPAIKAPPAKKEARKKAPSKSSRKKKPKPKPDYRFSSRTYHFSPQGQWPWERLLWLHKTMLDWSFDTGNRNLTQRVPYMGSLFTLLLPLIFFVRGSRRLWLATAFSYLAFATWGLTNANDRYLLAFLAIPIALTAALIVRVWDLGLPARVGLVPLVALQLFWSGDAPLRYGDRALRDGISLIDRAQSSRDDERLFNYRTHIRRLSAALPEGSVVLGRYFKDLVGFEHLTHNTHRNIQTFIDFRKLDNVRDFWQVCHDRGITHLLYPEGKRKPHWVQDIVLFDALVEVSEERKKVSGHVVVKLPAQPPVADGPLMVLVLSEKGYQDGLYKVRDLNVDERYRGRKNRRPVEPWSEQAASDILAKAGAIYMKGNRIAKSHQTELRKQFKQVERISGYNVWLRRDQPSPKVEE